MVSRKVRISLMGPDFIAAIGYIDPGNFATNIQAGSAFGYQLLWVIVWANIMAMFIQLLSAKLGIVTNRNLAEHIRDNYSRPVVWFYWFQAEIVAIATDLAEFIGAALGLNPTHVLIMSQVLLSFGIALALIPLLRFTNDPLLMGSMVNSPFVSFIGKGIAIFVISLNGYLLVNLLL